MTTALPSQDGIVAGLEVAAWALAAVVATQQDLAGSTATSALQANPERSRILSALALAHTTSDGWDASAELAAGGQAAGAASARLASLRQALAAAEGRPPSGWAEQPDRVLIEQGRASATLGRALAERVVPGLPGLAARLALPGCQVLDVGTGVGQLALALARALPAAHVVGIDIHDRALRLAESELARAGQEAQRVTVRRQDVAELSETAAFDLVWLPTPYLTESALSAALPRLFEALVPGGWIVAGTNATPADPLAAAVAAWQAARNGGSATDETAMRSRLAACGFDAVSARPTIPGGPILVLGRRPADGH